MYMESFNSCFIIRFVIIIEKEIDSFEYFIKGYGYEKSRKVSLQTKIVFNYRVNFICRSPIS